MRKSNNYGLKKTIFGATAFVAVLFSQMAFILATSYFLSYGLINSLPLVLVLVSVAAIVNFGFNVVLSKKLTSIGSLLLSIIILAALTVAGFYMRGNQVLFFFFVLLVARFATVVFDTSLTNVATSYVNSRQTKGFLPFIRGIMDVAVLTSSVVIFTVLFLGVYMDPLWLIVIGSILTVISLMVIRRVFEPVSIKNSDEKEGVIDGLKEGMTFIFKKSKLYTLFAWLFFVFGGIMVSFVYVYNNAFSSNLSGESLTFVLALVSFVAVFLRMIFNLKFLRWSIHKLGLANLLIVYPWIMFLITTVVMVLSDNLYVASALFIFHVFAFFSFVTVATQSMFELVPKKLNQQVYFFIKGVMPAVSAVLMSLLMWGVLVFFNNPVVISFILFCCVSAALAIVLRIQPEYQTVLLTSLKNGDMSLRTSSVELMGERVQINRGETALRHMVIDPKEDVVLRQKAMTSLVEIGNPNSIRELLMVLANDKNMRLRYYAIQAMNMMFESINRKKFGEMIVTKLLTIDVFHKVYDEDLPLAIKLEVNRALPLFGFDVLLEFYKQHFANSTDFVKAGIINAISVDTDRGLITLLEPFLYNENLEIRAAAIGGLWRFKELHGQLMNNLIDIFAKKDDLHRRISLSLISRLKLRNMEDYVLDLVAFQDKQISTLAIITSINLGKSKGVNVLVRKLIKFAMQNDNVMVEFIFRELSWLSGSGKKKFLNAVRALSTANFDRLQSIYNESDKYFDLVLADLFTN